jgi:RNA polymerase sporulation-specific sigma factor
MIEENEYELLYMYRKGDEQALRLLMKMVHPFILKVYGTVVSSWPAYELDEAMQAGHDGLLNAIYYYREDRRMSLRSFMLMCIQRQMYSSLRHLRHINRIDYLSRYSMDRMIKGSDELLLGDTLSGDCYREPQHISRYRTLLEQIYSQLEDHPLDCRVLALRYQGYTYQQTARILGVSSKDVDNSIQRIRRKIAYLFD